MVAVVEAVAVGVAEEAVAVEVAEEAAVAVDVSIVLCVTKSNV